MINFLLRKMLCENLNEVTSKAEIDVTLKVTLISTNDIASLRFSLR